MDMAIGSYIPRDDINRQERIDDLWSLEARFDPPTRVKPQRPDYPADFVTDLRLAGGRALDGLRQKAATVSGREALFTAIDGSTGDLRSRADLARMLTVLHPFENGEDAPMAETGALDFLPALSGKPQGPGDRRTYLPPGCACAMDVDGARAFVAADTGLRDVIELTQLAVAQSLVQRMDAAGLPVDVPGAVARVADVLGCPSVGWLAQGEPERVTLRHAGSSRDALGIADKPDT